MEQYTMQPGDFITSTSTYNGNKVFAIFEGKEIYSTSYASSKPDYTLLAHYESNPYYYYGGEAKGPMLEITKPDTPCRHKIYIRENPTTWKLCSTLEKNEFLAILAQYGYYWDEETWSIVNIETGDIEASIVRPNLEYNGEECQTIDDKSTTILMEKCQAIAKNIYIPEPPIHQLPQTHTAYVETW